MSELQSETSAQAQQLDEYRSRETQIITENVDRANRRIGLVKFLFSGTLVAIGILAALNVFGILLRYQMR